MSPTTLPPRSEIPIEETWNLESIFPSVEAWEEGLKETQALIPGVTEFQGKFSNGHPALLEAFNAIEMLHRKAMKVMMYGMLSSSVDTTDQAALARGGQGRSAFIKALAATAFMEPELLSIGFKTLRKWMEEEPKLAVYAHYFDSLERQQKHVRSQEVEEALAMAGEPLSTSRSAYNAITNAG